MPFEPSVESKEYYLYTKKTPFPYGGFVHPGLFSSRYTLPYLLLIVLVLGLEVYGMLMLYQACAFHYGFAVLLILLDLLFAFLSHLQQRKILTKEIELALNDNDVITQFIRSDRRKAKVIQTFILSFIVILAFLKMLFFYGCYQHFDALVLLIIATYGVVALIHIRVTGYTLFEIFRRIAEWNDYRKYLKLLRTTGREPQFEPRRHLFDSNERLQACQNNNHRFYLDESKKMYVLETFGLLTDSDLNGLVSQQQSPETKFRLSREGLRHQYYNILPSQPTYV